MKDVEVRTNQLVGAPIAFPRRVYIQHQEATFGIERLPCEPNILWLGHWEQSFVVR